MDSTNSGIHGYDEDPSRPGLPDQSTTHIRPKKRTRASRKAPTTVLAVDTGNFRAMVQQYTGIPTSPFSSSASSSRFDLISSPVSNQANQYKPFTSTPLNPMLQGNQGGFQMGFGGQNVNGFRYQSLLSEEIGTVRFPTMEAAADDAGRDEDGGGGREGALASWINSPS
ncbi:hypothetical protein Droror1_Dr00011299 [Drosera rotundifolia]